MHTYTKEALEERRTALAPEKRSLLLERLQGKGDVAVPTVIPPRPGNGPVPLSFMQERLWFLFEWEPTSPAYNEADVMRVGGQVNVRACEHAYLEIARRHEILRTTYQVIDRQPVQIIHPTISWSLPVIDLGNLSREIRETTARRLVAEETHRPFDLRCDLPWRVVLIKLAEEEHIIVITQHHISCDGWSIEVRQREFATLYTAFAVGTPPLLPELPIQYADFAYWQRERLKEPVLENLLAYWKEQLAGLTTLELPTDRQRPPIRTSNGRTQRVELSPALTTALTELARSEQVTSFSVYLSAFKALLSRYTGQVDVATGAIATHRDQPGLENVMGFFMETIILRTDLSGDPTFRQMLHQVSQVTQEAYAHKDIPFEHVVAGLGHKRDPSRTPLVQVLFDWQDFRSVSSQPAALPGLNLTMNGGREPTNTAKFDLTLFVIREAGELVCYWEYNVDLFADDTITRMAGHFQTLLETVVTDSDRRLSDLPLLAGWEREQLLVEWNATQTPYPQDRCFRELFEEQAAATPDSTALVCQDRQVTYAQLNVRANQLAHYLMQSGIRPGDLVAVFVERGIDFITSILAAFKTRCAFFPLDLQYPPARLTALLRESRCARVLAGTADLAHSLEEALASLPVGDLTQVTVLADLDYDALPADNPSLAWHPHDLAYVMFTSGSTGKPKGVMVEQVGMLNHLRAKIDDLQITDSSILCQNGPASFDIIAWQCIAPLMVGGCVYVVPDEAARDPVQLLRATEEGAVTVLQLVPVMLQQLVYVARESPPRLPSLRWMVPTGDALPTDLCRQWLDLYPGVPLLNTYGSTECSDDQCHIAIRESPPPDDPLPIASIGRPIGNMEVYILDNYLNPVPVGVPGELFIGGIGVGRGYLNRPGLTAKRFIPHPFGKEPGERLYRTGDLARYLPDGRIEFLGRVDFMVKVRGFRIELGEIEKSLQQHPAVREAVVVAREAGTTDSKHLVAYVIPNGDQEPSIGDLRHFLQERLPAYMVPSFFVTLDALPVTPNGKLNRKALPEPEDFRLGLETAYVAPRNEIERAIAAVLQEQLGLERVGVDDDFFELGGDSLLAMRLLNRVTGQFEVRVPLQHFFENPTLAGIAGLVQEAKSQIELDELPIRERLGTAFPTERGDVLEAYLRRQAARSLGVGVEQIPPESGMEAVAADLAQSLERDLGLDLSSAEIAARTFRDLADFVLAELDQARRLAELDELPDEAVSAMLGQLLAERESTGG